MAATDARAFPNKNQAYRLYFVIKSSVTGNPIIGGLAALSAVLFKDGAAGVASTNAPVEIGTTGKGYIDLTAAELNYSSVMVCISASNANALEIQTVLLTSGWSDFLNLPIPAENAGYATTIGDIIRHLYDAQFNLVVNDGVNLRIYKVDNETVLLSMLLGYNPTQKEKAV